MVFKITLAYCTILQHINGFPTMYTGLYNACGGQAVTSMYTHKDILGGGVYHYTTGSNLKRLILQPSQL